MPKLKFIQEAEHQIYGKESWGFASKCITAIENASPIEERKTGKWIISNTNSKVTTYKCSECGRIVHDDTGYDVSKDYPYCHCGADMRGKQE